MNTNDLTAERLRDLLHYDPTTGIFTWLKSTRSDLVGTVAGATDAHGYRIIGVDRVRYKAHRLAWLYVYGEWPVGDLDHVDCNRSNNCIANLRSATVFENNQNVGLKKSNTSGFKGASFDSSVGRWKARIRHDGRRINLGNYSTAEAAAAAYEAAAHKYHKEFARL